MRLDDTLCLIDDPDNLLTCDAMPWTCDTGLLGADLQALIHWFHPTRLGVQFFSGRSGGIAHGISSHVHGGALHRDPH